ncbi:MAG: CDP-alcohol phosphatidyltransferase family protein [Chloroflexaceae bacterium]
MRQVSNLGDPALPALRDELRVYLSAVSRGATMLRRRVEQTVRSWVEILVTRVPVLHSVSPNTLTCMTLALTIGVVVLIVQGSLQWAGALFLVASAFDMLDGAVARARRAATPFGAFLDSTVDRYSELLVFLGLLIYYQRASSESFLTTVLLFLAATGAILTSYVRARAEALGFSGRGGMLERPERVLILGVSLISGWTIVGLWILAIFSHLSALQRSVRVWMRSRSGAERLPSIQWHTREQ